MSLGLKVKEMLYAKGMKKFGPDLLRAKLRGSPEWLAFGQALVNENDFPTRQMFLKQATSKGFYHKTKKKEQILGVLLDYAKKGVADERRLILAFFDQNIQLFSKEHERFMAAVYTLQRDADTQVASAAEQILQKLGFEQNYHKPVR